MELIESSSGPLKSEKLTLFKQIFFEISTKKLNFLLNMDWKAVFDFWNLPSSIEMYSFFYTEGLKIFFVSKINLLWKTRYLLMWKNMSTIFFAPKLNNLWLLLCHGFWGPLELYSFSKMAKNLDSWPLDMPQKSEHWAGLKLNTCPVSKGHCCIIYSHHFILTHAFVPSSQPT